MCRGAQECNARVHASFEMIISRVVPTASHAKTMVAESEGFKEGISNDRTGQLSAAKEAILARLVNIIEEHKDKAFASTFLEPSKVSRETRAKLVGRSSYGTERLSFNSKCDAYVQMWMWMWIRTNIYK